MIKSRGFLPIAVAVIAVTARWAPAQDEPATTEVVEVVAAEEAAEADVEVVVEVAEAEAVQEEIALAMPVDNNQLKLYRYAQVECALVRRVCELTDEQTKKLAEIDNKWVDKAGKQGLNVNGAAGQQPGLLAMFFGAQQPQRRLRAVPKANVKKAVEQHIDGLLTEQQKEQYAEAKQRRLDFRTDAIADALIESLQDRLGMTDDQRKAIKEKILPWVAKQNIQTMHYFSGNNYYPEIPTHLLSKDLSKDQLAAYRSLQPSCTYMFTDDNFNDGQAPIVIKQ